jgi:hypothetical protein
MYRVHGRQLGRGWWQRRTRNEQVNTHTGRRSRQPLRKGSLISPSTLLEICFVSVASYSVESVESVSRESTHSSLTRSLLSRGTSSSSSSSSSSVVGAQQRLCTVVAGSGAACIRGDLAMATGANDSS